MRGIPVVAQSLHGKEYMGYRYRPTGVPRSQETIPPWDPAGPMAVLKGAGGGRMSEVPLYQRILEGGGRGSDWRTRQA